MTKPLLLIGMNILATGVLFALTKDANEPFIAPITEVSMILRWGVIAAMIALLQFIGLLGWRRAGKDGDEKTRQRETTSGADHADTFEEGQTPNP